MAYYSREDFAAKSAVVPLQDGLYRTHAKRLFDIIFVLLIAIPVSLLIAIFSLIIARDGVSPLYWQKRVRQDGKTFHLLKLRSMVPDADHKLEILLRKNPAARREWNIKQKLTNDPRVTKFGKFIRRTSLDELPQFWNVFCGDMSVVGPRPMTKEQVHLYPGNAYYCARPGITGFWQISERNECSFAERAQHDANYNRALSLGTDLSIIARTILVVATGTGV